jgi:hypothetical protein
VTSGYLFYVRTNAYVRYGPRALPSAPCCCSVGRERDLHNRWEEDKNRPGEIERSRMRGKCTKSKGVHAFDPKINHLVERGSRLSMRLRGQFFWSCNERKCIFLVEQHVHFCTRNFSRLFPEVVTRRQAQRVASTLERMSRPLAKSYQPGLIS